MKSLVLVLSVATALGACTGYPGTGAPATPPPGENECRASDYQHLIGKPKSQIPAEPAGATWRVTCTTCPVTMDYNPQRLNIFFDEATGVVKKVNCG